ncbi:hypothetical protein K502DRAFT_353277 [Neoconidiobolus thromboides FSU 785]|nr:hypothetical protein K502DRAFT_353277 [Neoconidiobolus thromboides FSU 785]
MKYITIILSLLTLIHSNTAQSIAEIGFNTPEHAATLMKPEAKIINIDERYDYLMPKQEEFNNLNDLYLIYLDVTTGNEYYKVHVKERKFSKLLNELLFFDNFFKV